MENRGAAVWSKYVIFVAVTFIPIVISSQKLDFPIGSDVTLKYKLPPGYTQKGYWSIDNENVTSGRDFFYEDTSYLIIRDFSEVDKGKYHYIINTSIHVATLGSESGEDQEKLVKFRSVGEDLTLVCNKPSSTNEVSWEWRSPDERRNSSIKAGTNGILKSGHFHNRLLLSNGLDNTESSSFFGYVAKFLCNLWKCLKRVQLLKPLFGTNIVLRVSSVEFNDSGEYKCGKEGITINLVTIQVNSSRTNVSQGDNVTLTCSSSHFVSECSITWAKISNESIIHVRNKSLTEKSISITHLVEGIDEQTLNWACLVFFKDLLVDIVPISLNYHGSIESRTEKQPQKIRLEIYLPIGVIILGILISVIVWTCLKQKRRGSTKRHGEENQTEADELKYASIQFQKSNKDPAETADAHPKQTSDQVTVIYAQVKE